MLEVESIQRVQTYANDDMHADVSSFPILGFQTVAFPMQCMPSNSAWALVREFL